MRFTTDIFFKGEPPFRVPTDYRKKIISIIKGCVKNNNPELFSKLWGSNKTKPFTFCAYIPGVKHVKEKNINYLEFTGDKIGLSISSYDAGILINFYNSLLDYSRDDTPFTNEVEFGHFYLEKETPFFEDEYNFRLMSPMVVRNMKNRTGKEYISHEHPAFSENIYHSVLHMCRDFIRTDYNLKSDDFVFTPVRCKQAKIYHYKEVISAVSGTFSIKAPAEVLKLVYDAGIGARRSQGFGMVEVVK